MRHAITILIALALAASAARAEDNCTTEPTATLETPAGTFYVWNDPHCVAPDCFLGLWIYQETNGVEGLQRCDEVYDECCNGQYESDMIIF